MQPIIKRILRRNHARLTKKSHTKKVPTFQLRTLRNKSTPHNSTNTITSSTLHHHVVFLETSSLISIKPDHNIEGHRILFWSIRLRKAHSLDREAVAEALVEAGLPIELRLRVH